MAAADRTGDRERDRLRSLCRLQRPTNWVEAEVRVALSRAHVDKGFLFIPALAAESAGSSALPPFAKLYQGVRDPLGQGEELEKLLKAVLQADWDRSVRLIDEPFVGLRSMREEEADRFFGRDAEVKDFIEKFRRRRIVAVVADSGTGKSSLAEAGFAPAFRGGALADPSRENPDERIWNVVTMRPRANPEEGLRSGVIDAGGKAGRPPQMRSARPARRAPSHRRPTPSKNRHTALTNPQPCQGRRKKTATPLVVLAERPQGDAVC